MVQVLLDAHWDRGSKNKEVGGVSVKGVYQIKKKRKKGKIEKVSVLCFMGGLCRKLMD